MKCKVNLLKLKFEPEFNTPAYYLNSAYMCCQGAAEKLVQHLVLHNPTADPSFVDDFLLTYRTFVKSSSDITSQLLTWFEDQTYTDKVRVTLKQTHSSHTRANIYYGLSNYNLDVVWFWCYFCE